MQCDLVHELLVKSVGWHHVVIIKIDPGVFLCAKAGGRWREDYLLVFDHEVVLSRCKMHEAIEEKLVEGLENRVLVLEVLVEGVTEHGV